MKRHFKIDINYSAIVLAISSFVIGTLLLLIAKFSRADSLFVIGLYYIFLAAILNGLMLLALLVNLFTNHKEYRENILTIVGVLANIPITYLYIELVFSNAF